MPPDLKVIAENMVKASMGLADTVMVATVEATVALFNELDRQHGMAGDDDAGAEFAKVYKSAAATTLELDGVQRLRHRRIRQRPDAERTRVHGP
ncbi:hypothetical protein [Streptomyces spiralis]